MVVIDGRALFRLVGIPSYPAKKRAEKTVERIKQLAEDPSFDPNSLVVGEKDGVYTIFGNELAIVRITSADVLLEGDFSPEAFADKVVKKQIARAIENYRYERLPETIKLNVIKALVRTSALAVILLLLFWSFKITDKLLEQHFKRKIENLESKSKRILKAQQVWNVLKLGIRFTRVVIVLFLIYFFFNFVLDLFPRSRFIANTLLSYTIDPLRTLWHAFLDYLPSLFFLIIIFILFRYLIRVAKAFFNQIDRGQLKISGFDTEWALPTYRIIRILLVILGVVIAYPYIPGSGSDAFKGISIFAGVLLSLGSSSLIANIIAGYTMTYRRAFRVGDRVKIGAYVGDVMDVRLMETHLRSLKNEEIVIPNSQILSGEVTNYSNLAIKQGLILHTTAGIGYEVPWRQVKAMLLMAAERTEGIRRKPEPFVLVKELGDFGVVYELNVFCRNVEKMNQIYSDLHCNIQDVFNEYDVAIMTPHYVGDTEEPKTVPKDKWYASPAQPPAK
ncbi:MAG: mechanosensitive ion channel family protein [Desulfofustis sp.]|nr:mechanosensitive ion channel family protein [Desulfofustis sp.]